MKLIFLGTAAGQEYPGIWCDCEYCSRARELGGKNTRRNSSVMLDDDVMIDMGKTAHIQVERFGKNIRAIKTLLITHSHMDHLDAHTLWARQMRPGSDVMTSKERLKESSARFSALPTLNLFGTERVKDVLKSELDFVSADISFTVIEPFNKYKSHNLELFILEANHTDGDYSAINYIIKRNGVTLLYLLDTGWPFDKTLDEIKKYKFDFIIVEGTFGLGKDSPRHMNLDKNKRLLEYFNQNGLWKNKADCYLTHLSPHWNPPHDDYLPIVEASGLKLAYDGLEIEY